MSWKSFLSLKPYVIVTFLVVWNGAFLLSIENGRMLDGVLQLAPGSNPIIGWTSVGATVFAFVVASSPAAQSVLVSPSRADAFSSKEFYLASVILAIFSGFNLW